MTRSEYSPRFTSTKMRKLSIAALFALLALSARAGQSFVFSVSTQTLSNSSVPAQTGAWHKDYYVDSIPSTMGTNPAYFAFHEPATDITFNLSNGCAPNSCLQIFVDGVLACNAVVGLNFPTMAFYLRVQHDAASLGAGHDNANNDTYAVDSSFTLATKLVSLSFEGGAIAYQIQTTATARNPTWTQSNFNDGTVANIATFKKAP